MRFTACHRDVFQSCPSVRVSPVVVETNTVITDETLRQNKRFLCFGHHAIINFLPRFIAIGDSHFVEASLTSADL
jgi:hypothetical protein